MNWEDYTVQSSLTDAECYARQKLTACDYAKELHYVLGMVTEVGELADTYKKRVYYGKELDYQNIREELGDIFWYLSQFMCELGFTLEDVLSGNIRKLRKRFPEGFSKFDACNRDTEAEMKALDGE